MESRLLLPSSVRGGGGFDKSDDGGEGRGVQLHLVGSR